MACLEDACLMCGCRVTWGDREGMRKEGSVSVRSEAPRDEARI